MDHGYDTVVGKESGEYDVESRESSSSGSVDSSTSTGIGVGLGEISNARSGAVSTGSLSWMGSWKRTLATATNAKNQIGELLSRPGKRYKELSEENAGLRRRVEELAPLLAPLQQPAPLMVSSSDNNSNSSQQWSSTSIVQIFGPDVIGGLQVVRVLRPSDEGTKPRTGIVIGVEKDAKLLSVQWFRKRDEEENSPWETIANATTGVGFYRTSVDDVDFLLSVEVTFSKLYCRLANEINSEAADVERISGATTAAAAADSSSSASDTDGNATGSSSSKLQSTLSSGSSSLISSSSDKAALTPEPCRVTAVKNARVVLSQPVRDAVARLDAREKDIVFTVVNKADPVHKSYLTTRLVGDEMKLMLDRKAERSGSHNEKDERGLVDDGVSDGTLELETDDTLSHAGIAVSLPEYQLGVFPLTNNETGLALSLRKPGSAHVRRLTLFANSNLERDMIVVVLRVTRGKVATAASSMDTEAAVQAQRQAMAEEHERQRTEIDGRSSVTSSSSPSTPHSALAPTSKVVFIDVYECAYPQVWEALGYNVPQEKSSKVKSLLSGNLVKSMTTFFSTALDPLGLDTSASTPPANKPMPALPPDPSPEDLVSFDLYTISGFGKEYDVEIELSRGEGLGITLKYFQVVRQQASTNVKWPKNGANCVVVSSFCPVVLDGEECSGKLESCGYIRPGDALVAVNGCSVEQRSVATCADLDMYVPCTLAYVSKLIQRARKSGEKSVCNNDNTEDEEDEEELERAADPGATPMVQPTGNLACRLRFTFRQGSVAMSSGSGREQQPASLLVSNENKLRARLEEVKEKLYEANARTSAIFQHSEQQLDAASARYAELCEAMVEQRALAERSSIEKILAVEQLSALRERSTEEHATVVAEKAALDARLFEAQKQAGAIQQAKDAAEVRVVELEANMVEVANESKAWVNAIGTKEDALRALETDLRAQQVKQANLQELLDAVTTERDKVKGEFGFVESARASLEAQLDATKTKLDQANDEADALTSRMRLDQEQAENDVERARRDCANLQADLVVAADKLSGTKAHAQALKEANATAEERTAEASVARQVAEKALHEEKEKCAELTQRVGQLQERLRSWNNNSADKYVGRNVRSNGNGTDANVGEPQECSRQINELEGANAGLRAQIKTMKNKLHSLSAEASKAAQLDIVVLEKNDLLVQVQLEKAHRMEAEEELSAYKTAMRKTAEQMQKKEAEFQAMGGATATQETGGAFSLWASRPPIFDHLYKKLLSEDRVIAAEKDRQ